MAAVVNCAFIVALFATATKGAGPEPLMPVVHVEHQPKVFSTDSQKSDEFKPVSPSSEKVELPDSLLSHVPPLNSPQPKSAPEPIETQKSPKEVAKSSPAPSEKKPPLGSSELVEIVVKRGDVLEKIARANGTSVSKLMQINKLKTSMLRIGQKLLVPKNSNVATSALRPPEPEAGPQFYTVKKGDNLWLIASRFKVKVGDLKALNHLDDQGAKRLRVGDEIRIR